MPSGDVYKTFPFYFTSLTQLKWRNFNFLEREKVCVQAHEARNRKWREDLTREE